MSATRSHDQRAWRGEWTPPGPWGGEAEAPAADAGAADAEANHSAVAPTACATPTGMVDVRAAKTGTRALLLRPSPLQLT
jgi:hypothetical protein